MSRLVWPELGDSSIGVRRYGRSNTYTTHVWLVAARAVGAVGVGCRVVVIHGMGGCRHGGIEAHKQNQCVCARIVVTE